MPSHCTCDCSWDCSQRIDKIKLAKGFPSKLFEAIKEVNDILGKQEHKIKQLKKEEGRLKTQAKKDLLKKIKNKLAE